MKQLFLTLLACCAYPGLAGTPGWLLSLEKAQEFAKKSGRPILINFTGSDWCGWCMKMKTETLSKPEFVRFASSNLILVELDFPRKAPQSEEVKAANEATKTRYGVRGFPCYVLVDPAGKELGRQSGYLQGGVPAFTQKLQGWMASGKSEKER